MSARQHRVWNALGAWASARGFRLGGGTAVALHLGHRRSVDLDWMTIDRFLPSDLAADLTEQLPFKIASAAEGTLHGHISTVRVSFLRHRFRWLSVALESKGAEIASLDDLAAMKLNAIVNRGSKKDFVDIWALASKHRSLRELLDLFRRKYRAESFAHVLYALSYFADADQEPAPKMLIRAPWRQIKADLGSWIRIVADDQSAGRGRR